MSARTRIAELGHSFIQDGCTLLVHGVSRVVTGLILRAAESKHFNVVVTESRPDAAGLVYLLCIVIFLVLIVSSIYSIFALIFA